jgi:hypothetical protein
MTGNEHDYSADYPANSVNRLLHITMSWLLGIGALKRATICVLDGIARDVFRRFFCHKISNGGWLDPIGVVQVASSG